MDKLLKMYVKAQVAVSNKLHDESGELVGSLAKILITIIIAGAVLGTLKLIWGSDTDGLGGMLNEKLKGLFSGKF